MPSTRVWSFAGVRMSANAARESACRHIDPRIRREWETNRVMGGPPEGMKFGGPPHDFKGVG